MNSIIGTKVTGNLGREGTDFTGTVVEEYRVSDGPLQGAPMVKVETSEGRAVCTFRAYVLAVEPNVMDITPTYSIAFEAPGVAEEINREFALGIRAAEAITVPWNEEGTERLEFMRGELGNEGSGLDSLWRLENAMEDMSLLHGDDRWTCHRCYAWATDSHVRSDLHQYS